MYRKLVELATDFRHIWLFLKELGLTGFVASSVMGVVVICLAWLSAHIAAWASVFLGISAFAIFAWGFHQFVKAKRITRFDPSKFKQLGKQLIAFSEDAHRALVDWEARNPRLFVERESMDVAWEKDRERDRSRALVFETRYMAQAMAHIVTLHGLGIIPPFQAIAGASSRPEGLISYLGAVGHLLNDGLVEEARSMNHERPLGGPLPFALLR